MCYQWGTALDGPAQPGSPRREKPNEEEMEKYKVSPNPSQGKDLSKQTNLYPGKNSGASAEQCQGLQKK